MPIIETEFEVFCGKCGAGLCMNTTVDGARVYVEPYEYCMKEAYTYGYDEGYEKGENRADEN